MSGWVVAVGAALGGVRQRARRRAPDSVFLGPVAAVVTAPPDAAHPQPAQRPGRPPAATRNLRRGRRRRAPGGRLAALGAWVRRHGLLRHEAFVAYLASALSIAAYAWYTQRGQTLLYADAIAHMMIAHNVLASHNPGLAQLGTVWPPLNHILMLPLVWIAPLYRDGFAGTLPSMVAYVAAAVYTYRTARLLFSSPLGGWAAALVLMLNPNVLYMQATPMSELDLLCFAVVAVYYAARWAQTLDAPDLVKCALATAAGTLVRYDGWALAVALLVAIVFIAWRRRGRTFAESNLLLYAALGFAGCAAWVIYQQVIFGNPLEFLSGPYSASVQQNQIKEQGDLFTFHNAPLSLHIYTQSVIDNAGLPLCIAALIGLVWWILRARHNRSALPALAALVPFGFNCLSLVLGISVLETPEIPTVGHAVFYNVRYGLMMLPAVALFAALLAARSRLLFSGLLALVLIFGFTATVQSPPYLVRDPLSTLEQTHYTLLQEAHWLATHYHGGEILISSAPYAPVMFDSGLPESDFLTDGDGTLFHDALRAPQNSAAWIVMDPTAAYDPVWAALNTRTDWRQYYAFAATVGSMQIYERITPGTGTAASGAAASRAAGVSGTARTVAQAAGFATGLATSRALIVDLTSRTPSAGGAP